MKEGKKTIGQKETELINAFLFSGIDTIKDQLALSLYAKQKGKEKEYQENDYKRFKASLYPGA